jgi:hypothetical protein
MSDEAPTPRPQTAAERKRAQRIRMEILRSQGRPPLTAETMKEAIYAALSLMLRNKCHDSAAELVIFHAGSMLFDSKRTTAEMRRRLLGRLPKVYKD